MVLYGCQPLASIVGNIFEKLDEYISEQSVGKMEMQKARDMLNENLAIVSESREKGILEQNALIEEKDQLIKKIAELEKEKAVLLDRSADQIYEDIYQEIKREIPLDKTVKDELSKYGITNEKLDELSPNVLFEEVSSWVHFVRNVLNFGWIQWVLILAGIAIIIFALLNPNHLLDRYLSFAKWMIISFFSISGPLFVNAYSNLRKFLKVYEPIKKYRDAFNKDLDAKLKQHQIDVASVNLKLNQKSSELENKTSELNNLNEKIKLIEREIEYAVPQKAFFDFIKNKTKDERYDKNQSIITTIRRDFETLSELFWEYNIPDDIAGEELKKARKKKKRSEEFKTLFTKPLDRIVLYIGDLDRCPEDRVIEVLEAVNLLMAYPLFVVVVGVDPRWVKNALIKKYTLQFTGLMNSRRLMERYGAEPIHVTDYLEKIFQVPFYLREADNGGVNGLLDDILGAHVDEEPLIADSRIATQHISKESPKGKQIPDMKPMEINTTPDVKASYPLGDSISPDEAKGHAELETLVNFRPDDLKISRQELADLKSLAWLVGTNPRALKRYANIYLIIRAHENLSYDAQHQRQNFLNVMFILGLSIGEYKGSSRSFFNACTIDPDKSLKEIVEMLTNDSDKGFVQKFKLMYITEVSASASGDLNRYIPFVKRFSFHNPTLRVP